MLLPLPDVFSSITHTHTHSPRCPFLWETCPNSLSSSYGKECLIEYSTFLSLETCSYPKLLKLLGCSQCLDGVQIRILISRKDGPTWGTGLIGSNPGLWGHLLYKLGVVAEWLFLEELNFSGL